MLPDVARGRRRRTQDEVFAEGCCFGSSINLPTQVKWIAGEKSSVGGGACLTPTPLFGRSKGVRSAGQVPI